MHFTDTYIWEAYSEHEYRSELYQYGSHEGWGDWEEMKGDGEIGKKWKATQKIISHWVRKDILVLIKLKKK